MRKKIILAGVVLASLIISTSAFSEPREIAIFVTRLGGDSASAQPYVDKFLRYMESQLGWPASSMKGAFLVTKGEVLDYLNVKKPGIGIMEPSLFFELRKDMKLKPILAVESKDLVSDKYNVVVKDPSIKTLDDLKGKRVWTTLAEYPRYLSKVVLAGKADAGAFKLKRIGQALRGVYALIRGDCDATILDDDQLAGVAGMEGGKDLRVIYTSPVLPPVMAVTIGGVLSKADTDALTKTLKGLCGTEAGAVICKEMHIGKFVPINEKLLAEALKSYGE